MLSISNNISVPSSVNRGGSAPPVFPYDTSSDSVLLMLELSAESAANFELNGSNEVNKWIGTGFSGIDAIGGTNKPTYESSRKAIDFISTSDDPLTLDVPVTYSGDRGYDKFIVVKQESNDKYSFGGSNSDSSYMFMRSALVSYKTGQTGIRSQRYDSIGLSRPTVAAIFRITHTGSGGTVAVRVNTSGALTGTGTLVFDQFYMNELCGNSGDTISGRNFNGDFLHYALYNGVLTDTQATAKINELIATYNITT